MRTLWSRIRALFRGSRLDGELSDEVGFHLAMLEEEFRARGMSPAEAKNAARREFGGVAQTQEKYRERRGVPWLETSLRDVRYALRGLRRNPGFTAAAVLSLALGIGANTAVFSLFYALMMRNLPVARPGELMTLYKTGPFHIVSYPLYEEIARRTDLFRGVLATTGVGQNAMARMGLADAAFYEGVSGNYFAVLGLRPAAGRLFSEADDRPGNRVAVLSYDYWQRHLGGASDVVGRAVLGCTVIGVAPPGFRGVQLDRRTDLWMPSSVNGNDRGNPRMSWLSMMARRRPDVSRAQVQAALDVLTAQHFQRVYGASSDAIFRKQALEQRIEVREGGTGMSMVRDQFGEPLGILMATVGIVLLAACANVAHLLLARGAARRKEIALRLSLGATRARLVRQALTESLALAAGGSALGALFALWGRQYVLHFLPAVSGNPFGAPDRAVLEFAAGVSLLSAALFGLAPAVRSTAIDPAAGLRGEAAIPRGRRGGLRAGLVIAQVAFAVVLVTLAALFGGSLGELRAAGAAFRNHDVIVFRAMFPTDRKDAPARFLAAVEAIPGVASFSSSAPGPYQAGTATSNIRVPGSAKTAAAPAQVALCHIAERYFETLGARVAFGREFNRSDANAKWDDLAVVNRAFVREFLPGEPYPVGRILSFDDGRAEGGKPTRIIGVVDDLPHQGLRQQPEPTVYLRGNLGPNSAVVATKVPARVLLPAIRRELERAGAVVISEPQTIGSQIDESIFQDRILASLSGFFGGVALLLTGVGLYGVVAYKTAQRTNEIGVRIALGAERGGVLWLVLRDALALVALGLAAGLPAAFLAARAAGAIVFGAKPGDPWLYVATALALMATGMAAAFLPASRAAAMDPMRALRQE